MMDFKKLNNITGWAVFAVSLIIYVLTVERTASFGIVGSLLPLLTSLKCHTLQGLHSLC